MLFLLILLQRPQYTEAEAKELIASAQTVRQPKSLFLILVFS